MKLMIARGLVLGAAISGCFLVQNLFSKDPETQKVIDSVDGPTLYKAYCAVCHGTRGKGDGPLAPFLKTPPADLTTIMQRHNGQFPRESVEKIISGDEARAGGHGPREMPVWGPVFSQIAWDLDLGHVRVHNLAVYIEELQAK